MIEPIQPLTAAAKAKEVKQAAAAAARKKEKQEKDKERKIGQKAGWEHWTKPEWAAHNAAVASGKNAFDPAGSDHRLPCW